MAKSEMPSQPRCESLYNPVNTKRCVAEALAVSGFSEDGAEVWLYLHDGNYERNAATNKSGTSCRR